MERIVEVTIKPNAKKAAVREEEDGSLTVSVPAPPKDGKANKALIELLAKHFSVPKSRLSIVSGEKSKNKKIEIGGGGQGQG